MHLLLTLALSLGAAEGLQKRADVIRALDYIKANHEPHSARQIEIAEIPAPTFHEAERAKFMAQQFRRVGLKNIEIDKQGNVLGWRPGRSPKVLVVAAHLDISFAPGVNTKVRKEGARWYSPGIADDTRGLIVLLALAEALDHARIKTDKTLLFVANVGEEGMGDLIGIRYLFKESPHRENLDSFVSIDGTDAARVVNGGTGVKRYRVTVRGSGGHGWGNFGRASASHAIGRMVAKIAALDVPAKPRTTYNVGRIGGGTAVNAIAEEAWMEVELRSESPAELDKLELKMHTSVRTAVEEENRLRSAAGKDLNFDVKLVSNRPAGQTAGNTPIVQSALWASRVTGHKPSLVYSSTDANFPISLGVPAITIGGGGKSDNHHSLEEWYEPQDAWRGAQTVLLTVLSISGVL